MSPRLWLSAAFAGAIALTAPAVLADDPPTPSPIASSATPLHTRPAKKLELASPSDGTPLFYKLLVGGVVVAAAIVYARKKGVGLKTEKKRSSIDLLARQSIGVRSELLVVDVEGTRLLVGMTPGSMNTLAVLQTPEGVVGEESPLVGEEKYMSASEEDDDDAPAPAPRVGVRRAPEDEIDELEGRVRSLLDARKKKAAPAPVAPARPRGASGRPVLGPSSRVPGQAKGLLLSMEDPNVTKLGDW